jgi:hypothetical protein
MKLVLVEAPGLTLDLVQRGDSAAHLFDLISEGDLGEIHGASSCGTAVRKWLTLHDGHADRCALEVVSEAPRLDGAEALRLLDERIPALRAKGDLVILGDGVIVSSRRIPRERGPEVTRDDVIRHLQHLASELGDVVA